jgi:hypothetical protein
MGRKRKGSLRRKNEAGAFYVLKGRIHGGDTRDTRQWPEAALAVSKSRRGGADRKKGINLTRGTQAAATERGEKGESWAGAGLVGRKEGWVGGLRRNSG